MRSEPVTSMAGEAMVAPLTATRPAATHASASRRDASPARAITFAIRCPGLLMVGRFSMLVFAGVAAVYKEMHGWHKTLKPDDFDDRLYGYSARRSAGRRAPRRGAGWLRAGARRGGDCAGRQSHGCRPRPHRACRNDRDPRCRPAARLRASRRLRCLCHARALRHVRSRAVVRPDSPPLLWRCRSQGRRGRKWRTIFCFSELPPSPGDLWRAGRRGGRGPTQRLLQAASLSNTPSFSLISDLTASAERMIALACRNPKVRKMLTFGRITRSGAAWPSFAATIAPPITMTVV